MRFGMMAAVGMLAATAGMAHGERESWKPWSVPNYSSGTVQGNIVLAQVTAAQRITPEMVRKVEQLSALACTEAENPSSKKAVGIPGGDMSPIGTVITLLQTDAGFRPSGPTSATLTQPPVHGKVVSDGVSKQTMADVTQNIELFTYVPEPNFYGTDHATFEVKVNNVTFRVKYTIYVLEYSKNGESCIWPKNLPYGQAEPTLEVALERIIGDRPRFPI